MAKKTMIMLMMMMRVPWRHLVQICRCFRPKKKKKDFACPPATVATSNSNWQLGTSNTNGGKWQHQQQTFTLATFAHFHFHSMPKRKAPHNFRAAFPLFGKWTCGER